MKSIGCVRRSLEKLNGETAGETRYFITSIKDGEVFGQSVRGHWGVENKVHWQLDFTSRGSVPRIRG